MEINLNDEQGAVVQYNQATRICADAKDEGSKALFDHMASGSCPEVWFWEVSCNTTGTVEDG